MKKGIPKEVIANLPGMPIFLQPGTQHQIVITNYDFENLEGMDLDLGSTEAETTTKEVVPSGSANPSSKTPASTKKSKFFWKWNSTTEDWLHEKCRQNSFSRSRSIKSKIFERGIAEKLWTDSVTCSVRVYNKIDTICKTNY